MNNFENNKENHIENEGNNWFREKRESLKGFLHGRKNAEEGQVREAANEQEERLKNSAIDSTLEDLNLDMQERLELQDSQTETKQELNDAFYEGIGKKDSKEAIKEKDLFQHLSQDNRFKNRSPEVVQQIAKSATNVENEIKQGKGIFYEIARKIMNTEK